MATVFFCITAVDVARVECIESDWFAALSARQFDLIVANPPRLRFGIVRSVSFPGVAMDVDRVQVQAAAKDNDKQKRIAFLRQTGAMGSAFEHAVPEKLFADPSKPANDPSQPQGVSAVKAIALAASQGQKVYTLNAQNQAYHEALLAEITLDAETRVEIRNALMAGMEVTAHQAEITLNGWTGSGYIILDPETGAGAYKISGGRMGVSTRLYC